MVNISGWRSTRIKSVPAPDLTCENCKAAGGVQLDVYQEYMHLFWIPYWPTKKTILTQCQKCGDQTASPDEPKSYQPALLLARKQSATPLWTFAGLPVVLFALATLVRDRAGFARRAHADHAQKVKSCLAQLSPGQIYEWNEGAPSYRPEPVKILLQVRQVDAANATYVKGLVQRALSEPLIEDVKLRIFDRNPHKIPRQEFVGLHFLDCQ